VERKRLRKKMAHPQREEEEEERKERMDVDYEATGEDMDMVISPSLGKVNAPLEVGYASTGYAPPPPCPGSFASSMTRAPQRQQQQQQQQQLQPVSPAGGSITDIVAA
jgi:hypothetical protein